MEREVCAKEQQATYFSTAAGEQSSSELTEKKQEKNGYICISDSAGDLMM